MDDRAKERRRRRLRRLRRHGRRAYIRSVYFLPSMATLGNAICGFAAAYMAALGNHWSMAAYLIFAAMIFDALDGRLARIARHTTDFGGQLDSLSDVVSFGVAPAFTALLLIKAVYPHLPPPLSRVVWAISALFVCCAALRLARFNVSNEHGEQHHFSFFGLPSPAAGGTVAAWIIMQQDLAHNAFEQGHSWVANILNHLSSVCVLLLPVIVLLTGLLMVSQIRYPHLVNRYLRGRRSIGRLILVLVGLLALVVAYQYVAALGMVVYVLWGATSALMRTRRRPIA
jgi:CDP-diacylglycerol---serine O-phosphatidyltransferase